MRRSETTILPENLKTKNTCLSVTTAIPLTVTGVLQSQTTAGGVATGVIEGRVFNAATSTALGNARVSVEGPERVVLTDERGVFQLADLPAGPVRLTVRYIGLEPQTILVEVRAGAWAQREVELAARGAPQTADKQEIVRLTQFTLVCDEYR